MTAWLGMQGQEVNHKRVARLLRQMGLMAVYPKPKLSQLGEPIVRYPFISVTKYGDTLLDDAAMPLSERLSAADEEEEDQRFFVETNLTTLPVFSPDGRFILFC